MSYALRRRPRSNDYDLIDAEGKAIGQVIASANGFTVYLLGDFEQLMELGGAADDALEAFEDWVASNTVSDILIIKPATGTLRRCRRRALMRNAKTPGFPGAAMVAPTGVDPVTFRFSVERSTN